MKCQNSEKKWKRVEQRMRRTLQGCAGPHDGGAFRTWPWFAEDETERPPLPLPHAKILRLRTVVIRINSLVNDVEADWTLRSDRAQSGPTYPSWLWYKPLADWYKTNPIDSFENCPDPKIKFFDRDLDELSFPKSPNKANWDAIMEILQDHGLVNKAGLRVWCPRKRFSILEEYPNLAEQLKE